MKVGIIGYGKMGQRRAEVLKQLGDKVVAVHDADGARGSASIEEVCRASDAVIVATTHDWLVPMGKTVLQYGRRLFLEKPGAIRAFELRTLSEAYVAYTLAHHPAYAAIVNALLHLGRILSMRGTYGHGGRPGYGSEWRCDPKKSGGGQLYDQGVHLIHLFHSLLSHVNPVHVTSATMKSLRWNPAVEDNVWFTLECEKVVGQFHATWTERPIFRFEVIGEHGQATWTGLGGAYGTETLVLESSHAVDCTMTFPREVSLENEWKFFRERERLVCSNILLAANVLDTVETIRRFGIT